MVHTHRSAPRPAWLGLALLAGTPLMAGFSCQEGNSTVEGSTSTAYPATTFELTSVTNGFGQLLPHRAHEVGAGGIPTSNVVDLRTVSDVLTQVGPRNPILPTTPWPTSAVLPGGAPGNHFVAIAFSAGLDQDGLLAGADSFIRFAAQVNGAEVELQGQLFVEGRSATGASAADVAGFPSVASIAPGSVVLVADTDGDLATFETFPLGASVSLQIDAGVLSQAGDALGETAHAAAHVGPDEVGPALATGALGLPRVVPAPGATGVDAHTRIELAFTEPVQPHTLGNLLGRGAPDVSDALRLGFGEGAMPFQVKPLSALDLTRFEVVPAAPFPGMAGPSRIDLEVDAAALADLGGTRGEARDASYFMTAEGPGIVNAPVAPDALYVCRFGGEVSVLDLNGFGGGTGNPAFDPANPIVQGNSNFPNNPNVAIQGALLTPPLAPGTTTLDGGSEGVFTFTKDSNLQDRVLASPLVESVADMMVGQPLDTAYNNGPPPFGCQSGGGNLCASTGLKAVTALLSSTAFVPIAPGQFGTTFVGAGNMISWAPSPNPPPLVFPPLCVSPEIGGQESTSIVSKQAGLVNLLVPGPNALGVPGVGLPPANLLGAEQNAYFEGPGQPQVSPANCETYQFRQQIGHFLYVADPVRQEVVVLNSNRMTVLDRIAVADPRSFAMSPNVDLLAVSSTRASTVDFIDIDPSSATFHQVVKSTPVGTRPSGIAWQPDNEDILVCHEETGELTVISAFTLDVRKVVTQGLDAPFEVAITQRHFNHATGRNTYFAFILDRSGKVALFESGPDGINGFGNDSVIGAARFTFENPSAIRIDDTQLGTAVWVTHERALDGTGNQVGAPGTGGMTLLELQTQTTGVLPLAGSGATMAARDLQLRVMAAIGASELTGVPAGIAMDNLVNVGGAQTPVVSQFGAGPVVSYNSKHPLRGSVINLSPTNRPQYAFVSVSGGGQGAIDVIDLQTHKRVDTNPFVAGVQSIPADGAMGIVDYFRQ